MRNIFILSGLIICMLVSCKKADLAGDDPTGEGLVGFTLRTPTSGTNLVLNAATPNTPVEISWGASTPGLNTKPTYTWLAALKTGGDFESPLLSIPADNNGLDPKLTLTFKQVDDALKAKGVADGAKTDLMWTVRADNGSTQILAGNVFNISITRFKDGASPFAILGPLSSTSAVTINPGSTTDSLKFNWTKSTAATGTVKYKVHFYSDNGSATPLFSLNSNNGGNDTLLTISAKDFSDTLSTRGLTNLSEQANLKWNVTATSGTWIQPSDYTNQFFVVREVNLFIVGGDSPIGWNPTSAQQFIQDQGRSGVYYMYAYLTAGNGGFKLLSMKADWGAPGQKIRGEANSADGSGNNPGNNTGMLATSGDGANIATPAGSGVYRITVDLTNNRYYVQKQHGRMGLVGGGTAANWTPGNVFPSQEMGYLSTNLFLGITTITQDGAFKMIDNSDWPNGNVDYTRDYEDAGAGKLSENGGSDFKWTGATGPVRLVWDYRDVKAPKYIMNAATEMRVVGNGMQGVAEWTPGASPQMTYAGAGKWTLTLNLIGGKEIKFLAGNDWGAFDYEDASGGSVASGTPRAIRWDGGDNFKTPAASGSYTITLDEYKGTVTFN